MTGAGLRARQCKATGKFCINWFSHGPAQQFLQSLQRSSTSVTCTRGLEQLLRHPTCTWQRHDNDDVPWQGWQGTKPAFIGSRPTIVTVPTVRDSSSSKKGAASDFIARKALARVVPMHRLYPCLAEWRRFAWQKCSRVNILVLCCCNDFNLEYENNKNAKNTKKHNVAGNNDPSRECACVFYSFPQNPTTGNTKEGAILTACVMLTNLYSART